MKVYVLWKLIFLIYAFIDLRRRLQENVDLYVNFVAVTRRVEGIGTNRFKDEDRQLGLDVKILCSDANINSAL